jgi:hypothetical protein
MSLYRFSIIKSSHYNQAAFLDIPLETIFTFSQNGDRQVSLTLETAFENFVKYFAVNIVKSKSKIEKCQESEFFRNSASHLIKNMSKFQASKATAIHDHVCFAL